jgi:hypothetical protein
MRYIGAILHLSSSARIAYHYYFLVVLACRACINNTGARSSLLECAQQWDIELRLLFTARELLPSLTSTAVEKGVEK